MRACVHLCVCELEGRPPRPSGPALSLQGGRKPRRMAAGTNHPADPEEEACPSSRALGAQDPACEHPSRANAASLRNSNKHKDLSWQTGSCLFFPGKRPLGDSQTHTSKSPSNIRSTNQSCWAAGQRLRLNRPCPQLPPFPGRLPGGVRLPRASQTAGERRRGPNAAELEYIPIWDLILNSIKGAYGFVSGNG